MSKKLGYHKIREAEGYLDPKFNNKQNVIKLSKGNTFKHELAKFLLCWEALQNDETFVTEARFKNGKRADLFIIDHCEAREVVGTETLKSIEKKKESYPVGISFFAADEVINMMLKNQGII